MVPDLAADLVLARSLADLAAEVALPYVGAPLRWGHKADESPVTEADLAVERALLAVLAAERPDDSVLSEEGGRFTDSLGGWRIDLHGGLYTNGHLHLLAATAGRAGDGPAPVP